MVEDLIGDYGNRMLVAFVGVGIALVCLVGVLRFIRGRGAAPFLRGGRNRMPRLQVLDAAAVDTRRRLVLVRRDDVEHLIMIGGPTDIVIESGIRSTESDAAPSYRPQDDREDDRHRQEDDRRAEDAYQQREYDDEDYAPDEADDERDAPPAVRPVTPVVRDHPASAPLRGGPAAQWRSHAEAAETDRDRDRLSPAVETQQVFQGMDPPEVDNAQDILEAARSRVLPRQQTPASPATMPSPPRLTAPALQPPQKTPPAVIPAVLPKAPARDMNSDFDRILENEFATNLEAAKKANARETAVPRPILPSQPPRRVPEPTGSNASAPDQKTLQREMARIFGQSGSDGSS